MLNGEMRTKSSSLNWCEKGQIHWVIIYNKQTVDHLTYSKILMARGSTLSSRGCCSRAYTYDKLLLVYMQQATCKEWWWGVIRLITQEYTGPMYIVLILT